MSSSTRKGQRSPAADEVPAADAHGSSPVPSWLARTTPEPVDPDLEPIFSELVDGLEPTTEVAE